MHEHRRAQVEQWLGWSANAVIVIATLANAFDITALNKPLFLLGCFMWATVGYLWQKPSLWTLNLFCAIVYIAGMLYTR
jgi:hypothetical protein